MLYYKFTPLSPHVILDQFACIAYRRTTTHPQPCGEEHAQGGRGGEIKKLLFVERTRKGHIVIKGTPELPDHAPGGGMASSESHSSTSC
ncbi:rap guanine nucleotide exchange factor 6-like isoform X12 [Lates japonicus]|uniref:Rap guanine nucleotide exchange factor 6-like isoform X12 n=1 Tax=Lates japonicus TaxID=270547 RepID=A0AAD3NL47_LATJO|nr:rap guanine nucleotide exchange factor 6-like isoform X12 [Lates japonicus]